MLHLKAERRRKQRGERVQAKGGIVTGSVLLHNLCVDTVVGLQSAALDFCYYWQNGYFAFHKYFYDKSCYRHAFKIHRLQLENRRYCVRGINCSKLNDVDHRIKFLVLIFKRTLILRIDETAFKILFCL